SSNYLVIVSVLVMGKFGSVQVFALFFSASSWTEGLFRGSFCSEVWLDQNIPQTESIVQFGVWQKGTQIRNGSNFPITSLCHLSCKRWTKDLVHHALLVYTCHLTQ
ncbi:hypothetical protein EDB83DRAFT_2380366, partial [Lactarius deliciosus]